MNINIEHYKKYLNAAKIEFKDGVWDKTTYPNGLYCFATKQKLGINGELKSHPMLGKKLLNLKHNEEVVVDSVCIRWFNGYYYHATLRNNQNSHAVAFIGNINCQEEIVLDGISGFNQRYKVL